MRNSKKSILKTLLLFLCVLFAVSFFNPETVEAAPKRVGWVQSGSNWYHYQKNGKKTLGFKKVGKHMYYFDTQNGVMLKNSWKKIKGKHYYFLSNGRMARSRWVQNVYYVNQNGVRQVNKWIGKYFVGNNGKWIPNFNGGWKKIGSKWFYYSKNGRKKTGWLLYKNKWYYMNKNGVMLVGRQVIKNKTYFLASSGALYVNGWYKDGAWYYYANGDGVISTTERMNTRSRSTATVIENNSKTLKVRIEKHRQYNCNYWLAKVEVKDAKQLVHALSYGTYGGTREKTSSATKRNNAIIGINGSAFSYSTGRPSSQDSTRGPVYSMCIVNGKVYGNYATSPTTLCIKKDGTLQAGPTGLWANDLLKRNVRSTLNFGPIILKNGKTVPMSAQGNPFSLVNYQDPRAVIGMVSPKKYVLLVADGRRSGTAGLNLTQMVNIMKGANCKFAYNLDGGGSATLSYRGEVLNKPSDGSERPCADFLLFKR